MKRSIGIAICAFLCLELAGATQGFAADRPSPQAPAGAVPGDRWMEIDLYWFEQNDIPRSVDQFWDRFGPLYRGVAGYKGVILNIGWTVGYVMEWTGDLQQKITLPGGSGEQPWVEETAWLPGATADRMREWKERFAKPSMVERKGYGPWSYGDLKRLTSLLRAGAERRGIHGFKAGSLVYAWDNAYGDVAPWAVRHPEAFTHAMDGPGGTAGPFRYFDPAATLHSDAGGLGGLPQGILEGAPVHQAFAAQWGSLSRRTGLDALMLRDSIGFPIAYRRRGPAGALMSSPDAIERSTAAVSALVRESKQANPGALIMMYSNGASALGDWRSNGTDLERIAREGFLDIFVDQTWAGAWNEVGVRHNTFWNRPTLGWTYQLAYTLLHGAILADTKVRHYTLVETFDAWESWDTLHTVPERLRWSIWAYTHAAVKTPHGLVMPKGSYISWANQGKRLLSGADVQFLGGTMNAAVRDAAETTEVFGPTLVYSRAAMQWQAEHPSADSDIKEWLDEQAGSLVKWPIPILSATRLEWLPRVRTDLPILQTPSHLPDAELKTIEALVRDGHPAAIFGSFAGGVDPRLLSLAGEPAYTRGEPAATAHQGNSAPTEGLAVAHVPGQFPVRERLDCPSLPPPSPAPAGRGETVYSTNECPQLLLVRRAGEHLVLWDPPDFLADPNRFDKPLLETWGGSAAPYALAAASLNALLQDEDALHARSLDLEQTGTVGAWKTGDGTLHLLFGNLEEGLREDSDRSRHIALGLPKAWGAPRWRSLWTPETIPAAGSGTLTLTLPDASSILLEGPSR